MGKYLGNVSAENQKDIFKLALVGVIDVGAADVVAGYKSAQRRTWRL